MTHSFSKKYFEEKFINEKINDSNFELFDIDNIKKISTIFSINNLQGLAVTIPYKQSVINFLDDCDDVVKEINACNCIAKKNNNFIGYNTDIVGFEKSFIKDLKPHHKKALVLGNGGAAKAVFYVLNKLKINFAIVLRNKTENSITYNEIDESILQNHNIIINTTPVGTFPLIDECPHIPYQFLNSSHYLFDLVYNPTITSFMQKGIQQNAFIKNGYEMLCIQAEENWKIWNEK